MKFRIFQCKIILDHNWGMFWTKFKLGRGSFRSPENYGVICELGGGPKPRGHYAPKSKIWTSVKLEGYKNQTSKGLCLFAINLWDWTIIYATFLKKQNSENWNIYFRCCFRNPTEESTIIWGVLRWDFIKGDVSFKD